MNSKSPRALKLARETPFDEEDLTVSTLKLPEDWARTSID